MANRIRIVNTSNDYGFTITNPINLAYYTVTGSSLNTSIGIAQKEIARALAGYTIKDYREAEIPASMFNSASNVAEAYVKTAYWMAVAARYIPSKTLAIQAQSQYGIGYAMANTYSSSDSQSISSIYKNAASKVSSSFSGENTPSTRAILAALGQMSTSGSVDTAKSVRDDRNVPVNTIKATSESASGLVTGKKPQHMSEWDWFWYKYKIYLLVGGAIAGGALYLSRPLLEAYSIRKKNELEDKRDKRSRKQKDQNDEED